METFPSKPANVLISDYNPSAAEQRNQRRSAHALFRGAEQSSDLCAGLEDGHVPLRQVFCDFEPATTGRSGSEVGGVI